MKHQRHIFRLFTPIFHNLPWNKTYKIAKWRKRKLQKHLKCEKKLLGGKQSGRLIVKTRLKSGIIVETPNKNQTIDDVRQFNF